MSFVQIGYGEIFSIAGVDHLEEGRELLIFASFNLSLPHSLKFQRSKQITVLLQIIKKHFTVQFTFRKGKEELLQDRLYLLCFKLKSSRFIWSLQVYFCWFYCSSFSYVLTFFTEFTRYYWGTFRRGELYSWGALYFDTMLFF